MGAAAGPDIVTDGLVLALDGANYKSFKGEATTNYYSTPETLTSGRTGSKDGTIKTDYTSGGPTGGRFTRVVRDTSITRTTDWEWQIGYSNTGLSLTNPFVVSFYARCPNGTLGSIRLSNPDVEGQTFNIDSTWRRFTASFTYGAQSGLTFFRFNRGYSTFSSVNGATYDLANVQIEAKSYSTTFTTGTRGTTVATGGGWADLTGNGNNGELVNGVRESSDNLGALVFDGSNDYVSTNLNQVSTFGSSGFTFNLALNVTDDGVTDVRRALLGNTTYLTDGFGFGFNHGLSNSNKWCIIFYPSYNIINFDSYTPNFGNNEFITLWYNGVDIIRLYRNGELLSSLSVPNTKTYKNGNVFIGTFGQGGWNYFLGKIYLAQIYNRALADSEIKQNYNALKGRFNL